MRKEQKQCLLDLVCTLYEAHEAVKKYIDEKTHEKAQALLAQCQEVALQMGYAVEQSEGEDCVSVQLLEEYCQVLYRVYESADTSANGYSAYKQLNRALIRAENSIKNDIPVRLEIAFLPYKASMWDSLESVYRAAVQDPDCDVYVVPIPYYDRNSDYSLGQLHYEGGAFPEDIPIVHYDAYELGQRKPDIIYIHNPYDEHNFVTSVDPRFYSSKLKESTGCLVYIPYCVYEEPDTPDQAATIEYCSRYITPALLRADMVILQSEHFRRALVNTLSVYTGVDSVFWKKKLLALGSPKCDKMRCADQTALHIPESWEREIKKPDGSRKRVVFYNTSLNALLKYGEQMNKKISSVLRLFYENREACTLLWRPHPLLRATIESMRPELSEAYREIVDTYRKGGWGIYDDTPDFHGALAVSDAYYGDFSSLMLLYQIMGKPMLMQNAMLCDYEKRFVTNRYYYDGEYIWGTAWDFNGLFRIHPETYKVDYIGQFREEVPTGYGLYYGIAERGEKLYFCPYNAKHIAVYDKASSSFCAIDLKESIRNIDRKFNSILAGGKYIYLQGSRAYTIVRLDTETNEITYIDKWVKELKKSQTSELDYLLQRDGCVHEGNLYFFSSPARGFLRLRMSDLAYEFIPVQYSGEAGFSGVISADGLLWLLPNRTGAVSYFDPHTRTLTELFSIEGTVSFCRAGGYIYYFSMTESYFYRIHTKTKEVEQFPVDEGIYASCPAQDKIVMSTYLTGELYLFDTVSLALTKTTLPIDEKTIPKLKISKMLESNRQENRYAHESGFTNLKDLMEPDESGIGGQCDEEQENCGTKIHKYVKGWTE